MRKILSGRSLGSRGAAIARAREATLARLARDQGADGRWPSGDADGLSDVGQTALALLAFLAEGRTHRDREALRKGLQWLIDRQGSGARYSRAGSRHAAMEEVLATLAMIEAHELSGATVLGDSARRAFEDLQRNARVVSRGNGGALDAKRLDWLGWYGLVLAAARSAELNLDPEHVGAFRELAGRILAEEPRRPERVAIGLLLAHLHDPEAPKDAAAKRAAEWLAENGPPFEQLDMWASWVHLVHGSLAVYQAGGRPWRHWNEQVIAKLGALPTSEGEAKGRWEPGGVTGRYLGPVGSTAGLALCLQSHRYARRR